MKLKTVTLKQILKSRGITQRQFTALIGCTEEFFSRVLKGRVNLTIDFLIKITRALAIDPREILTPESLSDFSILLNECCSRNIQEIKNRFLGLTEKFSYLPQNISRKFVDDLKKKIAVLNFKGGKK